MKGLKEVLEAPGFLGTHATFGADLASVFAYLFTILFMIGWYQARHHQGNRHHTLTLWGMTSMLLYFTAYYLSRQLGALAFEGRTGFGGSDFMYYKVFIPLLTIHITLVAIGIVMAIYMIILGFRASQVAAGNRVLIPGQLRAKRQTMMNVLLYSAAAFIIAYLIRSVLSEFSMRRLVVYLAGILILALVVGIELAVERWFPDGARRHRTLGTFTMTLYCLILVTSSLTYAMLYIFYAPQKIVYSSPAFDRPTGSGIE